MEQRKTNTLYILHYTRSEYGEMVLFYAQDEGEAWIKAAEWANSINFTIPKGAEMLRYPHGFRIGEREVPGQLEPLE